MDGRLVQSAGQDEAAIIRWRAFLQAHAETINLTEIVSLDVSTSYDIESDKTKTRVVIRIDT